METASEIRDWLDYIFDTSLDGISLLGTDLTIIGVNRTMERWYSHKRKIVGEKCYWVYHGRHEPCEQCPTLQALEAGEPVIGHVAYEGPEATRGDQELSVFPVYDDSGTMTGLIEHVRDITELKKEERIVDSLKERLNFQSKTLQEQESALRFLMRSGEDKSRDVAEAFMSTLRSLVFPIIDCLDARLEDDQNREYLDILRRYLEEAASPLAKHLSSKNYGLTPREIQVAGLIRSGKKTKEISTLLCITEKAVEFHRGSIRRKLGLNGKRRSLQAHLQQLDG